MTPSWTLALFFVIAGLWLARAAAFASDALWSKFTMNWPVPWPRMQPRSQRIVRVGGTLLGLAAVGLGLWVLPIWR